MARCLYKLWSDVRVVPCPTSVKCMKKLNFFSCMSNYCSQMSYVVINFCVFHRNFSIFDFLNIFYLIYNYVPSIGDWLICRKMSIFFYIWLYMDMKADGCTKAVFINHFSSSSCFEMLCKRREIPCDFWKLMLLFISTFF